MAAEGMDHFPVHANAQDEGRGANIINRSPQMAQAQTDTHAGRFTEVGTGFDGMGTGMGMVGGQRSPGLRSESRVSEVSDASFHSGDAGGGGRGSRLSGGSGAVSPPLASPGVVRRKPVGL